MFNCVQLSTSIFSGLPALLSQTRSNKPIYTQQDIETDNHSENVILTKEDQKIIQTVSQLLGIEAEKLKQVIKSAEIMQRLLTQTCILLRLHWSDK